MHIERFAETDIVNYFLTTYPYQETVALSDN